jgi:hypothetical protein
VAFTNWSLRNCGQLNKEQQDNDIRKTIEAYCDLDSKDRDFMFSVQADTE